KIFDPFKEIEKLKRKLEQHRAELCIKEAKLETAEKELLNFKRNDKVLFWKSKTNELQHKNEMLMISLEQKSKKLAEFE
ncbi:hypothetical protein MHBO_002565, partial [Bonamia ostreae]